MCCSCEPCTPNVFVFCSEGHQVWLELAPEKHSRSLQTSSSSLSLPQEPSCPGLHTLRGSLSVIPASRDEPVFDDSPPAERIERDPGGGSTKFPYLTNTISVCFIKKVSDHVFLELLSYNHNFPWPTFVSSLVSSPQRRHGRCSSSYVGPDLTYFLNNPPLVLNSPAPFYRFLLSSQSAFCLIPPTASGCKRACDSSLSCFSISKKQS